MKTLLAISLALVGCSFTPQSGQFRCTEGVCPTGLVCDSASTLCVDPDDLSCEADFCARFDEGTPQEGWTNFEISGGTTSTITRAFVDDAPSPPAVFRSSIGLPETGFRAARLSFQPSDALFASTTPTLEVEFSFSVTEFSYATPPDDADPVAICGIRYGADEDYINLTIEPAGMGQVQLGVALYEGGPTSVLIPELASLTFGEWHRVKVIVPPRTSVEGEPVGGGVSFELDGVSTVSGGLPAARLGATLRFDVGLGTTSPGSVSVDIDDVAINYLP